MPEATAFDVGDRVYVIDSGLDPVVQQGRVSRNIEQYTANVQVLLDERETSIGCHPDQVLPTDADADDVDDLLDTKDRL